MCVCFSFLTKNAHSNPMLQFHCYFKHIDSSSLFVLRHCTWLNIQLFLTIFHFTFVPEETQKNCLTQIRKLFKFNEFDVYVEHVANEQLLRYKGFKSFTSLFELHNELHRNQMNFCTR